MVRKFKIGQFVEYRPKPQEGRTSSGIYRITGLLPSREAGDEPEYLIRNSIEGYERLVKESELIRLRRPEPNERKRTKRSGAYRTKALDRWPILLVGLSIVQVPM